jgi:hypothetical protein
VRESCLWRCHRRIIADYLICEGEGVFHILASNRVDQALLTRAPPSSMAALSPIHQRHSYGDPHRLPRNHGRLDASLESSSDRVELARAPLLYVRAPVLQQIKRKRNGSGLVSLRPWLPKASLKTIAEQLPLLKKKPAYLRGLDQGV